MTRCASIFVYGTLMRGQPRESCWPHAPWRIQAAWSRGLLYDLGEFPALVLGDGWVAGECWELDPAHLVATLQVLDGVEEVPSLYVRTVAEVYAATGPQLAHLYLLANLTGRRAAPRRILPAADGLARWSQPAD